MKIIKFFNILFEILAITLVTAFLFAAVRMWVFYTQSTLDQFDNGMITMTSAVSTCIVYAIPAVIAVGASGLAITLVAASTIKKLKG